MTHICRQDLLTWGRLLKLSINWGKQLPKGHYGERDSSKPAAPAPPAQVGRINSGCCTEHRQQVGSLAREPLVLSGLHFHSPRVWGWTQLSPRPGSQQGRDCTICLHPLCNPSFSSSPSYNGSPSLETILWTLFPFIAQIFLIFLCVTQLALQQLPHIGYFPLILFKATTKKGKITSAPNTPWASNGSWVSEWKPLTYRLSVNSGWRQGGISRSFHYRLFADLALRLGPVRLQWNGRREFMWQGKAWFWQTHSQHTKICLNSRLLPYKMPWGSHTTHTLLFKTSSKVFCSTLSECPPQA